MSNLIKKIPDIGEGFVWYDEKKHEYYDEEMNPMISGSKFDDSHREPFPENLIANRLSQKIGLDKEEIKLLWNEKGRMSSEFGTLIHSALEDLINNLPIILAYGTRQKGYSTLKECLEVAYPSNIVPIISSFLDQIKGSGIEESLLNGETKAEVFVRWKNHCGSIDHLAQKNGIYAIVDYKFSPHDEILNYKGYGKYPEYTLQQNFYRDILEKNGMKVSNLILLKYNQKWRVKTLPIIDIKEEE